MRAGCGQRDTLGETADTHSARALGDAPGLARGALPAAVGRLARDGAAEQAAGHAAPYLGHDARVLVLQDQRRRPREETLSGVNVRAADAGGVDRHHDLARFSGGLGRFVYGESALAAPGRYLHV